MATPPLACTVRRCVRPLERRGQTWACAAGHSYDIARSGYVNLLQPQDRRSPAAGDAPDVVEARVRLEAAGVGRALVDGVVGLASACLSGEAPVVVDLGSGSGATLAALAAARPLLGVGIDLSTAAATHAARRHQHVTWVVANADRRLPLTDGSAAVVLSVHARRNPAECARVLGARGCLLVAVPADDDLIQLREAIQGGAVRRDRVDGVAEEHAPYFDLRERLAVRTSHTLDRPLLLDLLRITYRGTRHSESARVAALSTLTVTFASDIVVLTPRGRAV